MKLVSVRTNEAAKMLGISAIWLKKDRLKKKPIGPPFVKRGKMILYPIEGLKKWGEADEDNTGRTQ